VAETLQEIGGIQIKTGVGKTGVIGQMGTGDGPTIAIRADMDALPITEITQAEYASQNPGVMHACGHDAHTAILLGVAHLLKEVEQALSVARPLGGDYRLEVWRGYPAGWNNAAVSEWLTQTGADLIGADKIDTDQMGMGAEDFAYMCQKPPAAF